MGGPDPRLNVVGAFDFHMGWQFSTYQKEYTPISQIRLFSISIIHCIESVAQWGSKIDQAISDLAWIAFLFLLLPGKYFALGTDIVYTTFNIRDIQLFIGNQPTPATTDNPSTCDITIFVKFLIMTHKNGFKGESIGNGATDQSRAYEVASIKSRV